jgi:hypothetical protein
MNTTEIVRFNVGDGATICHHSDRTACTVVRVSASGATAWLQADTATLDPPGWKPELAPGGFAGHCTNQHEQRYTYQANPSAPLIRASLRITGQWRTTDRERVVPGRHKFYDYNF